MTVGSPVRQTMQYPTRTLLRAERAMRCSPFRLQLFTTMIYESVSLAVIAGHLGLERQYTRHSLSELSSESELLWLIQVGLLRREVDGQGLTDSFRVTPLGRQLAQKWQNPELSDSYLPTFGDRFYNFLNRWFQLPL
jgi:hypothetical protein